MLTVLFSVMLGIYLVLVLWFWLGWERLIVFSPESTQLHMAVTVIIPIRNEAENIALLLNDLEYQTFDASRLQVIVVDDNSDDDSISVVEQYQRESSLNLSLLNLPASTGKKEALLAGINQSAIGIILTSDGDCRVGPKWVEAMVNCFKDQINMVVGPVVISPVNNFFGKMQRLEFASLIGSGAATLGWHKPTMCNGANLAFRKEIFHNVGGYQGNLDQSSGDDVFLMHKIITQYPKSIHFCKYQDSIVQTSPVNTLGNFLKQRKRWAGKWGHYTNVFTRLLAVFVYLVQLSIIFLVILTVYEEIQIVWLLNLLIAKAVFEYFFLTQVMQFFRKRINPFVFLSLQIIYPIYVVVVGLMGFFGKNVWKKRKIK